MTAVILFLAPAGSGKSHALRRRLAELESAGDGSRIAVVDELETIARDPAQLASLLADIDGCNGGVRWLIASRSSAGVPIATWLARGRLEVVGPDALRVGGDGIPDWTEGWAIAAALQSRDLVHAFLEERAYGDLQRDELELLEAASLLSRIDVGLLETAGFESAHAMLERIRTRTSLVRCEGDEWRFAFDLIRESMRRRVALVPHAERTALYARIAAALETSGDDAAALRAYAAASDRVSIMRVLCERGFDLLDAGGAESLLEAVDGLDTKTRREDGTILALRGVAHASKGRPARAEALLRRALAHASADRTLSATITLRLALLLANRGDDVRALLEPIAANLEQRPDIRAEALSLIAAQRALSNDAATATAAVERVKQLLPSIDHDVARAKVLQRIGVAAVNTGDIDGAQRSLEEAADLAMELGLYSLASRAYANLCNLVLHEHDDIAAHEAFANQAVTAAERSGNPYDRQTALIQILRAATHRGDVEAILRVERELAAIQTGDGGRGHVVPSFAAVRLTWDGRFTEARQILARSHRQFHYLFDRAIAGALCSLLLAVDGKRESSSNLVTEIVRVIQTESPIGLYCRRRVSVALMYCSIAEATNRRVLQATRILGQLENDSDDLVIAAVARIAEQATTALRHRFVGAESCETDLAALSKAGYVDVVLALSSILKALEENGPFRVDLSPAEIGVLQMLSDGLSPKEIALRRGRSVFTVRAHLANAIAKLKCHGKLEAIAIARRMGVLA